MPQAASQMQSQTQIPAVANIAVVVAAVVLSRPFLRILNAARFFIGAFGLLSVATAFFHFEHERGTRHMGGATFGLFASIIVLFICIAIASALGFIPKLARALNRSR